MEVDRSKISPMMRQYFEVKDKYEDCILFSVSVIFTRCFLTMQ